MVAVTPIRLLVVDDHRAVRESIARLIAQCDDMEVSGELFDGSGVLEKVQSETFDVVLLDISMPRKNGFEVLRELRSELPGLPVIVLSIHSPSEYGAHALALGASGYVCKSRAADELIAEVRRVAGRP
ncbi:MAG: response regulator transcription factor [Candidatus Hydrogenedentes bacterium]|nr:response regulator transcription factor [Candidatus Hydrogenedentota bacterium]